MRRYLTALTLGVFLAVPVAMTAQDRDDHHDRDHRYYDAEHKDYHEWNEQENRAWRHWLEESHHHYTDWAKANARERREYWKWRHDHQDWH